MKNRNDCFTHLINMVDCILNNTAPEAFNKSYNQLQIILRKEYFTPFDREDIYMIAVKLERLYKSLSGKKSTESIRTLISKINDIIQIFRLTEKNKFRKLFNALSEYRALNTDNIILSASANDKNTIINLIEKCNDVIIQIEYTILKNS